MKYKKRYITILACVAIIVISFSMLLYLCTRSTQGQMSGGQEPDRPSSLAKNSPAVNSDKNSIPTSSTGNNSGDNTPKQFEASNGNEPSNVITGFINQARLVGSGSSEELSIRITLRQALSVGECTLTLTNTSTNGVITKIASIAPGPQSTCEGFDIPASELSSGKWDIKLIVKSGNLEGLFTDIVTIK